MTRPFVVLGAMKSGTTTMEEVLRTLDDVAIVAEKEATSLRTQRDIVEFAAKVARSGVAAAGEVSTAYMQRPQIEIDPNQALAGVPDLRVMAILREPFERAVSHWRHWAQLGRNPAEIDPARLTDPANPYVAYSSYHYQLRPWLDALGPDRMLVLRLEDYAGQPQPWVDQITDFLGVRRSAVGETGVWRNGADDRVVARGLGVRIAGSSVYRRVLRPMMPQAMRRHGAVALGGQRGGSLHRPAADDLRETFLDVIRDDTAALQRQWKHLAWGNPHQDSGTAEGHPAW